MVNPAVENQATDRAFRIGQSKNVQVRKLVCGGTLEDRIDAMIEKKQDLADRIVGPEKDGSPSSPRRSWPRYSAFRLTP